MLQLLFEFSMNHPELRYKIGGGEGFKAIKWEVANLDFELSARAAVREVFLLSDIRLRIVGCYFHFCQAVLRYAFGFVYLRYAYYNEGKADTTVSDIDSFHFFLRRLLALAYIPVDKVQEVFNQLIEQFTTRANMTTNTSIIRADPFRADLQRFLTYFSRYWMNVNRLQEWNLYDIDSHYTTSLVEAYHSTLAIYLGVHSAFFVAVRGLQSIYIQQLYDYHQVTDRARVLCRIDKTRAAMHAEIRRFIDQYKNANASRDNVMTAYDLNIRIATVQRNKNRPIPPGGNSILAENGVGDNVNLNNGFLLDVPTDIEVLNAIDNDIIDILNVVDENEVFTLFTRYQIF